MNKKTFYFLFIFLGFSLIIYGSPASWFIYFPKTYMYLLSGFSVILQLVFNYYFKRITENNNQVPGIYLDANSPWILVLCLTSLLLFIFLPVRNLNLGDGILLLEHVALEAKIFGYHLTMDEVLEALIHSILFAKFQSIFPTPLEVYRLVSTLCGFLTLGILFYFFRKLKITIIGYFLILSSGGMYLFHGYSENYTIITLVLWFYILFTMQTIRAGQRRNLKALLPICSIACLLILLHLVSGYLFLSLVYLCYVFSDKGKFIRNAFYSTVFSLCILAPVFIYFTFFSEVRFDFTQTHLTNPKFYPISKMISANHFRDIFFCILGSTFLPVTILLYCFIFYRKDISEILKREDLRFLSFVLFGFSIHGFVHYPQLGFPADWDLLAFYWTPISFLSVFLLNELDRSNKYQEESRQILSVQLIPIFLFAGLVFILNAVYLSKSDESKIAELHSSLNRIERYSKSDDLKLLNEVKPGYKKFYLKVSFFLFESAEKIKDQNTFDREISERLLAENRQFRDELENHILSVDSIWQKDYYSRLTRYHLEYLELLKKK